MTQDTSLPTPDDQEERNIEAGVDPALDSSPSPKDRPCDVPDKFWDRDKGEIRVDALLRSYRELERHLGRPQPQADARAQDDQTPDTANDYVIEAPHPAIAADPAVNERLRAAGLTQDQAQLVYDLAADYLLPALADTETKLAEERDRDRLASHFGKENWPNVRRQLDAWGKRGLSPDVYAALASSYDGVVVMHDMMRRAEPDIVGRSGESAGLSEERLNEMVRDPRYWRDRDPAFVGRVTEGFKRFYGG